MLLMLKCGPTNEQTYERICNATLTSQPNDKYDYITTVKGLECDRETGGWKMLSSKIFVQICLQPIKCKRSVKTTKACIEKLLSEGIFASDIVVMTPPVVSTSEYLRSEEIDCACQVVEVDLLGSSLDKIV